MSDDKIFLVMYSTGSWDDYTEINLFATYSEDYAKAYIEKFNTILNKWKQHWKKFDDDDQLWRQDGFKNFDRFHQITDMNTAWYYPIQIRK